MASRSRGNSRKKSNVISVDFSGVETLERFHEDGEYPLRVKAASQEAGDKADYISWELECTGDPEGAIVYNNTSLSPQSLWNLKAFLEALGVEVPDDAMDIDLDEVIGLEFTGVIEMEKYEGKPRPRLVDFYQAETKKKGRGKKADEEDDKPARSRRSAKDEEDDKPARRGRSKKDEPEEDDAVTEDAINDMDEDELADFNKEHKLKVDLDDYPSLRKMRAAIIEAATDKGVLAGDGEDNAEEEEEKPARRRRSRR